MGIIIAFNRRAKEWQHETDYPKGANKTNCESQMGFSSGNDVERNPMLQATKCAHHAHRECLQVLAFLHMQGKYLR